MDILIWIVAVACLIALGFIYVYVARKVNTLFSIMSERFSIRIEKENLGKVFFMPGKYLLISCSLLLYGSAFGFLYLIVNCSSQNEALSTIIWECTKLDLAQRGNLTLVCYVPLFLAITFIIGFLVRLIRKNNFLVATEIGIYSVIFVLFLPLYLLFKLFDAVMTYFPKWWKKSGELNAKRREIDREIERQAKVAHDAVNKRERGSGVF